MSAAWALVASTTAAAMPRNVEIGCWLLIWMTPSLVGPSWPVYRPCRCTIVPRPATLLRRALWAGRPEREQQVDQVQRVDGAVGNHHGVHEIQASGVASAANEKKPGLKVLAPEVTDERHSTRSGSGFRSA